MAGDIIAKDGFGSLYKGLGAGLLRQATYTTARLGIFNTMSEELKKMNDGKVGASSTAFFAPNKQCSTRSTLTNSCNESATQ